MQIGVLCEVSPGLRASERAVAVPDIRGHKKHLRIDADYIREVNGRTYLPVGLIYEHPATNSVLVELPLEADSGEWRVFVPKGNVQSIEPVPA